MLVEGWFDDLSRGRLGVRLDRLAGTLPAVVPALDAGSQAGYRRGPAGRRGSGRLLIGKIARFGALAWREEMEAKTGLLLALQPREL